MMNKNLWLKAAMLASSSLLSLQLAAAPGTLIDLPLDVSREVQPNVLFLLDDSGSMSWSQLISEEGQDFPWIGANGETNDTFAMPPVSQRDSDEKCARYNLLAYDPTVKYEPWSGKDSANVPVSYVDLNLTLATARRDPYLPATINISDHLYTSFIDANTDDTLNEGECGSFSDFNLPEVGVRIGAATTSNAATGVLHDPGGPYDNYDNNIDLQGANGFIIDPSGATDLQITFTEFNTQGNWDSVYVTQLDTDNLTPMGAGRQRFDGANFPGPFNFNTGQALIEFTSNGWWTEPGFTLSWNHSGGPATTLVQEKLDEAGCRASANCTLVKDLPLSVINTPENYVNWFSYYRTRELVAKKAMSGIIAENSQRLGLATLNNNDRVGTLVKDMRVSANKTELLTNLFEVRSGGGTPLRRALNSAGRYFQEGTGIPTDLFFNGVNTPNHTGDGTISNNSPIFDQAGGGICQQNFTVLFSDGEWTNNNIDGLDVDDRDGDGAGPFDGGTFADTFGPLTNNVNDTLADVAMRYLEEDLAGGLSNNNTVIDIHHIEKPPSERRVIPHQHMSTYTVAFGLKGTLDGNPGGPDVIPSTPPSTPYVFPGWTNPFSWPDTGAKRTDDMRHAAWNGRGEFLSADNPAELISTLNAAIDSIGDRTTATSAGASFNSTIISTDTLVFRGSFITNDWTGDLQAFQFDDNGIIDRGISGDESDDAVWSASAKLAAQLNADFSSRNVVTFNGDRAVAFDFPDLTLGTPYTFATLTEAQADRLLEDFVAANPAATAEERRDYGTLLVNYLKGDSDNEGTLFRERFNQYLGPIINSSPQFVGVPSESYPDLIARTGASGTTPSATDPIRYSVFQKNNINRTPLVFVGGNDGMLHAFEAGGVAVDGGGTETITGGNEVFAYIPSFLENNIQDLSEDSYAHRAYVDGTPTVRDVYLTPFPGEVDSWRTYLVGAARSGGRGIFVLDVTDPSVLAGAATAARVAAAETFNSPVKFEFTSADDADLGFVYGRPQIAKMNNGKWVAIVPNGYNSSGDGAAKLFIIDLENGQVITKIDTGVGSRAAGKLCTDSDSNCNGLSSPTIADLDGDFIVDRIYAGDLHGNMWVFDVSSSSIGDWDVAFDDAGTKTPLFTACANDSACSSGSTTNRQAITVAPAIIFHPSKNSLTAEPNVLVYFGTGQFIAVNDQINSTTQSFYAVWDSGKSPLVAGGADRTGNLRRTNLQQQGFFGTTNASGDAVLDVRGVNADGTFSANAAVDYSLSGEQGWFIDFELDQLGTDILDRGRSVISPLVINEIVVFVITVPTGNICLPIGSSNIVGLDSINGSAPRYTVFTDPDTDGNGFFIRKDNSSVVGLGSIIDQGGDIKFKLDENDSIQGVQTSLGNISTRGPIPSGRKSWSILR
jgi:type IV pilus assembly protein PilY1